MLTRQLRCVPYRPKEKTWYFDFTFSHASSSMNHICLPTVEPLLFQNSTRRYRSANVSCPCPRCNWLFLMPLCQAFQIGAIPSLDARKCTSLNIKQADGSFNTGVTSIFGATATRGRTSRYQSELSHCLALLCQSIIYVSCR